MVQLYSYSFHPDLTLKPEMWLEYLAAEGQKRADHEVCTFPAILGSPGQENIDVAEGKKLSHKAGSQRSFIVSCEKSLPNINVWIIIKMYLFIT